ncbi:hypothetical protein [Bacillus mobilis]
MIDERVLAVAGVAVLILIAQGLLHLSLTAAGVYLPNRAQSEPDSSDDRRALLEYWTLLRERFHHAFRGDDGLPGDDPASEGVPRDRPAAAHERDDRPGEVRARAALIGDHANPSRFPFRTGMLIWPSLVLLIILSTVFNW